MVYGCLDVKIKVWMLGTQVQYELQNRMSWNTLGIAGESMGDGQSIICSVCIY